MFYFDALQAASRQTKRDNRCSICAVCILPVVEPCLNKPIFLQKISCRLVSSKRKAWILKEYAELESTFLCFVEGTSKSTLRVPPWAPAVPRRSACPAPSALEATATRAVTARTGCCSFLKLQLLSKVKDRSRYLETALKIDSVFFNDLFYWRSVMFGIVWENPRRMIIETLTLLSFLARVMGGKNYFPSMRKVTIQVYVYADTQGRWNWFGTAADVWYLVCCCWTSLQERTYNDDKVSR